MVKNYPGEEWEEYERLKREVQKLNLSPKEYEKAIRGIVKRLGL
jgi:hypothetical protein